MKRIFIICSTFLFTLACQAPITTIIGANTETPPVIQTRPIITQTQVSTATQAPKAYFTTTVIVDTISEAVTRQQAQALVDEASRILFMHTPFGVKMLDFVEDSSGGKMDAIARNYISTHSANVPDGIMIFSVGDNGTAKSYGGYAFATDGPAGFRNPFYSPITGNTYVYIGVVHFSHKYAACGYAGQDTIQSNISGNGECGDVNGVACVDHNGYSMCSNAVNDLYASTRTYFAASSIVHEILHSFGTHGNRDHYATPECDQIMGWAPGYFDVKESQIYNGMCPVMYDNLINAYQP